MIIRIVVVLPAPLAPTNPVIWPAGTSKDTWSTAMSSPKRLVSSRISSTTTTLAVLVRQTIPARRRTRRYRRVRRV